jgi:hypothetical protein
MADDEAKKKLRRDFKGVWIDAEIWLSKELSPLEKMIFAEIHSLDNEFGCVADNEHFETSFHIKERQVRNYIKSLKDRGLISVTIDKKDNSRVIKCLGKYAYVPKADREELNNDMAKLRKKFTGFDLRQKIAGAAAMTCRSCGKKLPNSY